MSLTIGSLYSGIAGLELGLLAAFAEAGIDVRVAWQCEIDPFCQRVLAHHFPDVQRFRDVATVHGAFAGEPIETEAEMAAQLKKLTTEQALEAVAMYEAGQSLAPIAQHFGVTRQSMWDLLRRRTTMRPQKRVGAANSLYRGGPRSDSCAQNLLEVAIRQGRVARKDSCERCGETGVFRDGRSKIQAHHDDYNQPLAVRWLCQRCHHEWHKHNKAKPVEVPTDELPPVDVVVGGFMCTDVSSAGKGAGLGRETRSGHTLFHLLRIIDELRPPWVVIENVASGAKRWLPRVVQELGDRGYRPRAVPLGAVDVGAPHLRRRVFVVADLAGARLEGAQEGQERGGRPDSGRSGVLAHGLVAGLEVVGVEQARRQQPTVERGGGSGGEALAHGHGLEGERRGGLLDGERAACGDDADGCGGEAADALPDARRVDLRDESGRLSGSRGAGAGEPGDDGAKLADAAESRRAGAHGDEWARRALEPERRGDAGGERAAAFPGVGQLPDGLPFDVAGHRWPAGPGQPQEAWEPPRTLQANVRHFDRPAKLRALGNAVVPQCALVVGRVLVAAMRVPA